VRGQTPINTRLGLATCAILTIGERGLLLAAYHFIDLGERLCDGGPAPLSSNAPMRFFRATGRLDLWRFIREGDLAFVLAFAKRTTLGSLR